MQMIRNERVCENRNLLRLEADPLTLEIEPASACYRNPRWLSIINLFISYRKGVIWNSQRRYKLKLASVAACL